MSLRAYEEWAEEPLVFPIKGKNYAMPELSIDDGLRLAGVFGGTDKSLNGQPINVLFKLVLGDAWDEMHADGVPLTPAWRAGMAALAYHKEGRAAAEAVWESGINPEALAAFLAAKQSNSADSTPSPSTESASETPSPASTRPTTSRKATPRKAAPKKAARSRGRSSSSSGT